MRFSLVFLPFVSAFLARALREEAVIEKRKR